MDEELIIDDLLDSISDNDLENFKKYIGKVDINAEVKEEHSLGTLLHYAIYDYFINEEILDIFINAGADINKQNTNNGDTPLHAAIDIEDNYTLRYLLNKGADYSIQNNSRLTPKEVALVTGNKTAVNIIDFYIEEIKDKLNIDDNELNSLVDSILLRLWNISKGNTILSLVCGHSSVNLNKNISIFGPALHTAIAIGASTPDVTDLLLNKGANINQKNQDEHTPLHLCVTYNNPYTLKFLIERGASITEEDKFGNTALQFAKSSNHKACLEIIENVGKEESERTYKYFTEPEK